MAHNVIKVTAVRIQPCGGIVPDLSVTGDHQVGRTRIRSEEIKRRHVCGEIVWIERQRQLDITLDNLRARYGKTCVLRGRACFDPALGLVQREEHAFLRK